MSQQQQYIRNLTMFDQKNKYLLQSNLKIQQSIKKTMSWLFRIDLDFSSKSQTTKYETDNSYYFNKQKNNSENTTNSYNKTTNNSYNLTNLYSNNFQGNFTGNTMLINQYVPFYEKLRIFQNQIDQIVIPYYKDVKIAQQFNKKQIQSFNVMQKFKDQHYKRAEKQGTTPCLMPLHYRQMNPSLDTETKQKLDSIAENAFESMFVQLKNDKKIELQKKHKIRKIFFEKLKTKSLEQIWEILMNE